MTECLEDLESRIDEEVERDLWERWAEFARGECTEDVFVPRRMREGAAAKVDWPVVGVNETLDDFDAMVLHQFRGCSVAMEQGSGWVMHVRANYGTPIMPMLWGVELFRMPEEADTLPASRALAGGGVDAIRKMLDGGEPSLDQPYMNKVWEMGERYREIGEKYPKIGRHVHVYHPDLQGPIDILEMLVGSEMFMLLMDEAELVHEGLELITRTYVRVMRKWETIWPRREDGLAVHWGWVHGGAIMLRGDSAMNLSPEMFEEFIRPYDQRLLDELGGGAVHSCGRVDHFVEKLGGMRGVRGFNMSQPQLNDVEKVLENTVDRGVVLLGMAPWAVKKLVDSGRVMGGGVHCNGVM